MYESLNKTGNLMCKTSMNINILGFFLQKRIKLTQIDLKIDLKQTYKISNQKLNQDNLSMW